MELTDAAYLRREFARLNERLDGIEATLATVSKAIDQSTPVPAVNPAVCELLRSGLKLQAIKAYQQSADVDLRTAEAFIERWGSRIARGECSSTGE